MAGALGALAAGGPTLLDTGSSRWLFAYAVAAAFALPFAASLSPRVERGTELEAKPALHRSRGIVTRLAGLFALDSLGGGFVVQAFIAYWFARKFGTSAATLGVVFFAVALLQAVSFQIAVRLAGRIGLLRTMVFTHLPSNVLLALVPLMPTQSTAIALLLGRFALSQMDVPTRQAYVVAVVDPDERTAASAYTNTARYVTRPVGPLLAGPLAAVALGLPFVIGGAIKSVYDLGLFALFRRMERR
jgi:predicted MFS family arabinose efflux permease